MSEVSHDTRDTFAEAAQAFVELVRAVPPDAWDGPGLGEWDLRSLVGHTSRSLITVETYLSQPANREDVVSAAAYYAAISTIDPAAVAGRGREAGRALGDDPVAAIQSLVTRVLGVVERAENPLITSAAGECGCARIYRHGHSNSWCTAWTSPLRPTCRLPTMATRCCRRSPRWLPERPSCRAVAWSSSAR